MKDKFSVLIRLLLLVALLFLTSCGGGDGGTPDDNYEPNNDMASAYSLYGVEGTWLSSFLGLGIQYDDDWYRFIGIPGEERVRVDLLFTHADGDIDLELYDASGTLVETSASATDDEHIDYIITAPGFYYYIRVYYSDAGNTYDLRWNHSP